jgi:sporulation protein YlmC with PRC-barrel domain
MKPERLGGIMNKQLLNIQMFAEFDGNLQDLIKKNNVIKEDGTIDADALIKANEMLNSNILKYNSKNQPKVDDFKIKAKEEVIKELGIEGVTNENQLKAKFASLSSDEKSQDLIDLQKRFDDLDINHKELTGKHTTANNELIGLKNVNFLIGKGANPDFIEGVAHKIAQQVNEETDFATAYESYATANPQYFTTAPEIKAPITTSKPHVVASQGKEVSSVEQILIDKGRLQQP